MSIISRDSIALMMIICTLDELNESLLVPVSFYSHQSICEAGLEVVGMWWCFYKPNLNWQCVKVIEQKERFIMCNHWIGKKKSGFLINFT